MHVNNKNSTPTQQARWPTQCLQRNRPINMRRTGPPFLVLAPLPWGSRSKEPIEGPTAPQALHPEGPPVGEAALELVFG